MWRLLLPILSALLGCTQPPSGPPNIILMIGDDHAYTDFGFMGSTVAHTPNLDRLAEEGVVFTHGYSSASVCRPALLTLLTGLEPLQFEVIEPMLRKEMRRAPKGERPQHPIALVETLPRLLGEHGYATFQSGKYWEEHYRLAGFQQGTVEEPAFDGGMQQANRLVRHGIQPELDFIERNREGRFFLWFAPVLPHLPFDAPRRYHERYADLPGGKRGYYANITWLDDGIGQLLDALRELGLERDTLLVYLVDNGWDTAPAEAPELTVLGGPKGKMSLHGLGLRTPIVLRWPDVIEASTRREEMVSFTDVFVTLLDYAGVPVPEDRFGHSLRPVLEEGAPWPREDVVGWVPTLRGRGRGLKAGGYFWRDHRWHYARKTGEPPSLYDLASDPQETTDVSAQHPEVVEHAEARIDAWAGRFRTQTR